MQGFPTHLPPLTPTPKERKGYAVILKQQSVRFCFIFQCWAIWPVTELSVSWHRLLVASVSAYWPVTQGYVIYHSPGSLDFNRSPSGLFPWQFQTRRSQTLGLAPLAGRRQKPAPAVALRSTKAHPGRVSLPWGGEGRRESGRKSIYDFQ